MNELPSVKTAEEKSALSTANEDQNGSTRIEARIFAVCKPPRWPFVVVCVLCVALSAYAFHFYDTVPGVFDWSVRFAIASLVAALSAVWPEAGQYAVRVGMSTSRAMVRWAMAKDGISEPTERTNNFGIIRVGLATIVIAFHCCTLTSSNIPIEDWSNHQINPGLTAVAMFFAASGYLVTNSIKRTTGLIFMRNRFLRIVPGYVTAWILTVGLIGTICSPSIQVYLHSLKSHALTIMSCFTTFYSVPHLNTFRGFQNSALNGSLWTIRYEMICYLTLLLVWMVPVRKHIALPLTLFALLYAGDVYFIRHDGNAPSPVNAIFYLVHWETYFWVGVLVAFAKDLIRWRASIFVASLSILVWSVYAQCWGTVFPVFGAYLLFYIAFLRVPRLNRLGTKNDISFGLYVYSFPITQALLYFTGRRITAQELFLASIGLAASIGFLSWRLIEKPALDLKGRKNNARITFVSPPVSSVENR